jgi:acetyl esterase/lipase
MPQAKVIFFALAGGLVVGTLVDHWIAFTLAAAALAAGFILEYRED